MAHDLNIPTIADGQADDQWQTSNDGDAGLGNALSDVYLVDFAAGNVTLTAAQYRSAMVFKPSVALAAARTLTLPAVKRPFIFHNPDATYTVTLKSTDGASPETALTKAVAPGEIFIGYTNGSSPGLYGAVVSASGGGGSVSDGDKGDITVSSSGATWTIDNDVVTYAKMQNVSATSRILGRKTASAGDTEECTLSEILDFIGSASQGDILYRAGSAWARLGAGTSGQFLKTLGAGANPAWSDVPYDIPLSFAGTPTAGQLIGKLVTARDVAFAANFSGSFGHVGTNPAATFAIDVRDNGSSIGTISISTGGVFTFTTSGGTAKTITAGHRLEFYAPANSPAEATVANIAATLKGTAV
ncbi:hypothetical protein [Mesorhizobium sp.]|uniref:hypothetical protein n=1 Tax=Mesorhizobium sp. TaxID=1871066 RepID=UPI000FE803D7|nr:hypothetical protein [Mesorhizobium sp.]RWN33423.1 MAG: hypothetical protein EOR95_15865 [Mesorhizobium sp.]